jgi:hypothetical protein
VAEARVHLDVVRTAHGVDRAVAARDRPHPGFRLAHPELVPPVEPLSIGSVRREDAKLAAHVRYGRIRERPDEHAKRIGRPGRIRVGERHDVGIHVADGTILGRHLAAARVADNLDARELQGNRLGSVVRRVGGDDDLELLRRVVELEEILEPPGDHGFLIVRGYDHRDRRLDVGSRNRTRRDPRDQDYEQGIENVRPCERGERNPESNDDERHDRGS